MSPIKSASVSPNMPQFDFVSGLDWLKLSISILQMEQGCEVLFSSRKILNEKFMFINSSKNTQM